MPSLSELNGYHEELVARVARYAERLGWRAVPVVYHDARGGEALKLVGDETGLYMRTLPDLVVTNGRSSILVEVKTHVSNGYHDATPELFPIVVARTLYAALGVRTLYIYEDPVGGISGAWWAHQVFVDVPVRAIYIGAQRSDADEHAARISRWRSMGIIPHGVPVYRSRTRGSGDPYAVIPEGYLRTLVPWHYVLDDLIGEEVSH